MFYKDGIIFSATYFSHSDFIDFIEYFIDDFLMCLCLSSIAFFIKFFNFTLSLINSNKFKIKFFFHFFFYF